MDRGGEGDPACIVHLASCTSPCKPLTPPQPESHASLHYWGSAPPKALQDQGGEVDPACIVYLASCTPPCKPPTLAFPM